MVSRDKLNGLIQELDQQWENSTEQITQRIQEEIARRGGIQRINPEVLTEAAVGIEAELRSRAIVNTVIRALLQQIEDLQGRVENLESRLQAFGSAGPTGTSTS